MLDASRATNPKGFCEARIVRGHFSRIMGARRTGMNPTEHLTAPTGKDIRLTAYAACAG